MPTFIATPATIWVVPTVAIAITGQVDAADACNVIDVASEGELDATCQDHEAQDSQS